ncbi:FixJ family two-component response regulator, partial [Sphingomonas trueperi]|nr:FixJ family two-component response regulator [Sphingomonas trueperi]
MFLTGHGDIAMSVQALKLGAVDFLTKPFRHQALLDAIARATEQDRNRRAADGIANRRAALLATLTPREHQVLRAVVNRRRSFASSRIRSRTASSFPRSGSYCHADRL